MPYSWTLCFLRSQIRAARFTRLLILDALRERIEFAFDSSSIGPHGGLDADSTKFPQYKAVDEVRVRRYDGDGIRQ